ncbi:hypothetical protein SAMN05192540_4005 [Maribacter dokdonensis]|uniref:Uncharacterized protein n=1 Tax=Maribacter dokdonensis TaxID=320912 RepID=A0A1H4WSY8_9FLAO|nr:hypothetical protein [Maribacter dokdonensis]SEC96467.1 hypothetical protein SAMN05192540_4005 [Maribacter dokdonensis]
MSKKYTVSEISRQTGDNPRQVQRKLKDLINIEKGSYTVDESIVNMLYPPTPNDNLTTPNDIDVEYDIIEGFSTEEYQEFQKRLVEYPLLKEHLATIMNELAYHRKSGESKDKQMELILANIQQRNFIEAKDKQIDK